MVLHHLPKGRHAAEGVAFRAAEREHDEWTGLRLGQILAKLLGVALSRADEVGVFSVLGSSIQHRAGRVGLTQCTIGGIHTVAIVGRIAQ